MQTYLESMSLNLLLFVDLASFFNRDVQKKKVVSCILNYKADGDTS